MPEQLTLYTAKVCPYAHRTELALQESGLSYTRFEIDLQNKPVWYASLVNPASKVPAIAYGGPPGSDSSKPTTESAKLAESLVLLEFIADVSGKLLPPDPVSRARVRFFIDAVARSFNPSIVFSSPDAPAAALAAVEHIQSLLPTPDGSGFASGTGQWTIADAALAPFVARIEVILKNDLGVFESGSGVRAYEILQTDDKFKRFRTYWAKVKARESFEMTFDEEYIINRFKGWYEGQRTKKAYQQSQAQQ